MTQNNKDRRFYMLLMEKSEFDNWSKTRSKGKKNYILKTSLIGYISVFLIYFTVNGYLHWEHIDRYLNYNLNQAPKLIVVTLISIAALALLSLFFWNFNEKRYNATLKETNSHA